MTADIDVITQCIRLIAGNIETLHGMKGYPVPAVRYGTLTLSKRANTLVFPTRGEGTIPALKSNPKDPSGHEAMEAKLLSENIWRAGEQILCELKKIALFDTETLSLEVTSYKPVRTQTEPDISIKIHDLCVLPGNLTKVRSNLEKIFAEANEVPASLLQGPIRSFHTGPGYKHHVMAASPEAVVRMYQIFDNHPGNLIETLDTDRILKQLRSIEGAAHAA